MTAPKQDTAESPIVEIITYAMSEPSEESMLLLAEILSDGPISSR
jgi:hypothetical protein